MDWEITRLQLDLAVVGKMGTKVENWGAKGPGETEQKKVFALLFGAESFSPGFVTGHQ